MRVLIVDEDAQLANLLKISLQFGFYEQGKRLARAGRPLNEGLEVQHAASPEEALRWLAAAAERVDLIFTDLPAGREDGYRFLETCRKDYRDRYGEIIVVTERGQREDVKRGILAGARDYILKPFTPEDLMEHVFAAWHPDRSPAPGRSNSSEESAT